MFDGDGCPKPQRRLPVLTTDLCLQPRQPLALNHFCLQPHATFGAYECRPWIHRMNCRIQTMDCTILSMDCRIHRMDCREDLNAFGGGFGISGEGKKGRCRKPNRVTILSAKLHKRSGKNKFCFVLCPICSIFACQLEHLPNEQPKNGKRKHYTS